MRFALCLSVALVGCSPEQNRLSTIEPGWSINRDKYRNRVFYRFADKSKTTFFGICDSRPMFSLYGGDYEGPVELFNLTIDGKIWQITLLRDGHHGGVGLPVFDASFVDIFRSAKQRISFRVGNNWVRSFKPDPLLRTFIDECRAMRIRDPKAQGT